MNQVENLNRKCDEEKSRLLISFTENLQAARAIGKRKLRLAGKLRRRKE
jgi:hypothetical protein